PDSPSNRSCGEGPRGHIMRVRRLFSKSVGAAPLIQEVSLMSNYDRYASPRPGSGYARSGVAVDQGLRAYMIGVYNYMTLGLGVTGLVAYAAFALGTVNVGNGRLAL